MNPLKTKALPVNLGCVFFILSMAKMASVVLYTIVNLSSNVDRNKKFFMLLEPDALVFEYFGKYEKEEFDWAEDYYNYTTDSFFITSSRGADGSVLLSATLHGFFDKPRDCPIQLLFQPDRPISKRKRKRIFQLINHMLRNKKSIRTWGDIPGYDDLGIKNYIAFCSRK